MPALCALGLILLNVSSKIHISLKLRLNSTSLQYEMLGNFNKNIYLMNLLVKTNILVFKKYIFILNIELVKNIFLLRFKKV